MRFGGQLAATPPASNTSPSTSAASHACWSAAGHSATGWQRLGAGPRPLGLVVIAILAALPQPLDDIAVALHRHDLIELMVVADRGLAALVAEEPLHGLVLAGVLVEVE